MSLKSGQHPLRITHTLIPTHARTRTHTHSHTPSLVHRSVSPGVSFPEPVVGVYREHLSLRLWWWVCLAVSIPEPVVGVFSSVYP